MASTSETTEIEYPHAKLEHDNCLVVLQSSNTISKYVICNLETTPMYLVKEHIKNLPETLRSNRRLLYHLNEISSVFYHTKLQAIFGHDFIVIPTERKENEFLEIPWDL